MHTMLWTNTNCHAINISDISLTLTLRARTHIHEYEFECTGAEKHEIQYISMAGVHTDTNASTGMSHPETY